MSGERMRTYTDDGSSGNCGIKGREIRHPSLCKSPRLGSGSGRTQALPRHSDDSTGKRILFIGSKDQ